MEAQDKSGTTPLDGAAIQGPLVGVAAIVCRRGQMLMGRRCGSHGAETWALSGGKLAAGETFVECAIRELFEETGMRAVGGKVVTVTNDVMAGEGLHFVTVFVEMNGVTGAAAVREPDRCRGWGWFSPHFLPSPLFAPLEALVEGNPEVLERCCFNSQPDFVWYPELDEAAVAV
jgi:8-oxo-dGTP diphosphatase